MDAPSPVAGAGLASPTGRPHLLWMNTAQPADLRLAPLRMAGAVVTYRLYDVG
jgi:hypothetical protein